MRLYDRVWRGLWSGLVVLAVGLAVLEWSALGVVVALGLLVLVCWAGTHLVPGEVFALLHVHSRGWTFVQALTAALTILSLWSIARVSPALSLLVVLTAVATSPWVVGRAIRSARGGVPAATHPAEPPAADVAPSPGVDGRDLDGLTLFEALGPLQGLDDRQLCRMWRDSFWVLGRTTPPGTVLRIVALREACLDELEHRHGAGVRAWLESGARASGGPEKYLDES